jgi:hypothetical protein
MECRPNVFSSYFRKVKLKNSIIGSIIEASAKKAVNTNLITEV